MTVPLQRKAGRELDAEIEQIVFMNGVTISEGVPIRLATLKPVSPYSTDIAAAWLVVARMREIGYIITVSTGEPQELASAPDSRTCCVISEQGWRNPKRVWDQSAPLAICRAALAALEATDAPAC